MGSYKQQSPSRPQPVPVPGAGSSNSSANDPERGTSSSATRAASTARLASPVPSSLSTSVPPVRQIPTPAQLNGGSDTPLAGVDFGSPVVGPGRSALAAALEANYGRSPPRHGTPPVRPTSPMSAAVGTSSKDVTKFGSFDGNSVPRESTPVDPGLNADPEVVKRHLVRPSHEDLSRSHRPSLSTSSQAPHFRHHSIADGPDLDEFSSLQLEGGDVHRGVYRWAETDGQSFSSKAKRSKSFNVSRPEPESEVLNIQNIKVPGGFRRNFLRRSALSPTPASRYGTAEQDIGDGVRREPELVTNNFIEFLTLYGHFAGHELEDDEDDEDEYFSSGVHDAGDDDERGREPSEGSALITPRTPGGRRSKRPRPAQGRNNSTGAALLLLKSFVGTGVLFLPRAFLNGGMLFSSLVLLGVAALSYYCFILLVATRLKVEASFGDMGGIIYGKAMRNLILASIVLSQIGFVAAYIVFTSENLQAFVVAISHCRTWIDIKWLVLMQMVIFLPLSLIRDISKLGFTALIADVFILLGLIYLYYFDVSTLIKNQGPADIVNFNPRDWTLFIGTAIFTFEGIGLIIPIQESMKRPADFPAVLALVMVVITVVFTSMGAISYATFGSSTKTVILLNLPQDSKFVNAVQFLYSLAILLSTPLQLFPAIRILETELFTRSGKNNPLIKWKKNVFRFCLVTLCALIAWGGAGDLDKFVALVGSFACVPLVYVYPPLLHYKAIATSRKQRYSDIALSIFGVIAMGYTTAMTIINWAGSAGQPTQPGYCDES